MRIRLGVVCLLLTATGASTQSLEQQAICAKQAKVFFEEMKANQQITDQYHQSYESHYNTKLNKCFIHVHIAILKGEHITKRDLLFDAFEKRGYAEYFWASPRKNSCDLSPTSQDKDLRTCASKGEYDAFVAKYMED